MKKLFQVDHQSKKSRARLGQIKTARGVIKTPAFVPVATKGTLKSLPPNFIKEIGTQVAFVNTYHLVTHPGTELIAKAGGIHNFAKLNILLMSDSGGFQIFSLAQKKVQSSKLKVKNYNSKFKIKHFQADVRGEEEPLVIKISEDGVKFRSTYDGRLIEFTPEKSMEYQQQIGADLMMAFDECTYYLSTHDYARTAMERTHQWLKRCVKHLKARYRFFRPLRTSDVPSPKGTQAIGSKKASSLPTEIDIIKSKYKSDLSPFDKECNCYVCKNFTKAYLHHLFKQKEILGYTLATYHNLWVMERFFEAIRSFIIDGKI